MRDLIAAGTNKADIILATNKLAEIGGGMVVVADGKVLALIEMPLLGLQPEDPVDTLLAEFDRAFAPIRDELGCTFRSVCPARVLLRLRGARGREAL